MIAKWLLLHSTASTAVAGDSPREGDICPPQWNSLSLCYFAGRQSSSLMLGCSAQGRVLDPAVEVTTRSHLLHGIDPLPAQFRPPPHLSPPQEYLLMLLECQWPLLLALSLGAHYCQTSASTPSYHGCEHVL